MRDFAKASQHLAKTDRIDAGVLAQLAQTFQPAPVSLPNAQQEQLRALSERRRQLVQSVPGVGPQTACVLLAELPELGRISSKALAALVGVAPFNRDSGHFQGRRHIWGGRAHVRAALYRATVAAIRCNPVIRAFYHRLKEAGKASKGALVACLHKRLSILNALVRTHRQGQAA